MSVKVINNISQMRADAAAHKKFKCPACRESFKSNDLLLRHAETVHKDEIPEGFTAKRWLVGRRYDRWEKICDICHLNKTEWQESAGRYKPICESTECRQKWRQQFMDRFKKKNGTDQDIANPEYQKKMQAGRKVGGEYTFKDGTKLHYLSSYEKEFLEYWDKFKLLPGSMIEECHITFNYTYEGASRFYMPDFYIPAWNLIIEIKSHESTHPKIVAVDYETEKLKDQAVIDSKSYSFIKIVDNDFTYLDEMIDMYRGLELNDGIRSDDRFVIIPKRDKVSIKETKIVFLPKLDDFFAEEMIHFYETQEPLTFVLTLRKDNIPSEYLTEYSDLPSDKRWLPLRESVAKDVNDRNGIARVFKEFDVYHVKKYDALIAQEFMTPFIKFDPSKFCVYEMDDDDTMNAFTAEVGRFTDEKTTFYIVHRFKGVSVLVSSPKLAVVDKIAKKMKNVTRRPENLIEIPGTVDCGELVRC